MKHLLVTILLITVMAASAELQIGLGTQLIQEIGTDPYFPLVGQVKMTVPVTSGFSLEARAIGETYRDGNSSTYGIRTFNYSALAGIGYRMDAVTISSGGGVHYFNEEYVPRAYGSLSFELNYLQRVELIATADLTGDPQPMGAGFIFSIGI